MQIGFYALCHDREAQVAQQADQISNDVPLVVPGLQVGQQRAVELDAGGGDAAQVHPVAVATAEIVDTNRNPRSRKRWSCWCTISKSVTSALSVNSSSMCRGSTSYTSSARVRSSKRWPSPRSSAEMFSDTISSSPWALHLACCAQTCRTTRRVIPRMDAVVSARG